MDIFTRVCVLLALPVLLFVSKDKFSLVPFLYQKTSHKMVVCAVIMEILSWNRQPTNHPTNRPANKQTEKTENEITEVRFWFNQALTQKYCKLNFRKYIYQSVISWPGFRYVAMWWRCDVRKSFREVVSHLCN